MKKIVTVLAVMALVACKKNTPAPATAGPTKVRLELVATAQPTQRIDGNFYLSNVHRHFDGLIISNHAFDTTMYIAGPEIQFTCFMLVEDYKQRNLPADTAHTWDLSPSAGVTLKIWVNDVMKYTNVNGFFADSLAIKN